MKTKKRTWWIVVNEHTGSKGSVFTTPVEAMDYARANNRLCNLSVIKVKEHK